MPFEDVTLDELKAAMAQIPRRIVTELAKGPRRYRYACTICEAFTPRWYKNEGVWDRTNSMHIVFCYHEVPKIHMKIADDQWRGPLADDVYQRCMDIYRIAKEVVEEYL
jgi:hypothetical protein